MEVSNLTETKTYADLFCRSILEDIPYWQAYLEEKAEDDVALRRKREQIHRNIQFALDLEEGWQPLQILIENFSSYAERWGYWSEWQTTLKRALKVAYHRRDQMGEVKLSTLLARLSQRQRRSQDTIGYYRHAIQAARNINDLESRARAYSNLGFLYAELGYWWRAEVLCCHALAIFEALDHHHGLAHTENHLGFLYMWQSRWNLAQQHLMRACKLWQLRDDQHGLMRGFINLSALYISMERPNEALEYLEKAMHQVQLTGEETEIGTIYMNVGLTHRLRNDLGKAEAYARQAETVFRKFSNTSGLAQVWENLGVVYSHQGKWSEAILHLENALEVWHRLKNTKGEVRTLMDLIECELMRDNFPDAALRLSKVESLIKQDQDAVRYRHLHPRLIKYRRSLAKDSPLASCDE